MTINYITDQSLTSISGGWSGINYHVFQNLKELANVNYIDITDYPIHKTQIILSRIQKLLGLKRNLAFLSEKRLTAISKSVINRLGPADHNFFWGIMPWLKCDFDRPYSVYLDAGIRTYLSVFLPNEKFRESEIKRAENLERKWLNKASHIFWGSGWAMEEANRTLRLENPNQHIVWVGGNIPIPERDNYKAGINFTFISLRFKEKGGFVAFEAFKDIHRITPSSTLTIIGEEPPQQILSHPGVIYAGLLKKDNPEDMRKFNEILKNSFCMIHPTVMDTMGAVIIESGYYGCPTIAPKSFGIPELILDGVTGFTVDVPFSAKDFTQSMANLIEHPEVYARMRKNVREHCLKNLTYHSMVGKIYSAICRK